MIETSPGENGVDALTFSSADGSIRSARYGGWLTLYNSAEWELETDDVDGDGVIDFKLFSAHGTMGCTYYELFIFAPDAEGSARGSYAMANVRGLCNLEIDKRRQVLTGFDGERAVEETLRWDGHKYVPLPSAKQKAP